MTKYMGKLFCSIKPIKINFTKIKNLSKIAIFYLRSILGCPSALFKRFFINTSGNIPRSVSFTYFWSYGQKIIKLFRMFLNLLVHFLQKVLHWQLVGGRMDRILSCYLRGQGSNPVSDTFFAIFSNNLTLF